MLALQNYLIYYQVSVIKLNHKLYLLYLCK
jgi:hypothetical protein